jgi:hypothetical protein
MHYLALIPKQLRWVAGGAALLWLAGLWMWHMLPEAGWIAGLLIWAPVPLVIRIGWPIWKYQPRDWAACAVLGTFAYALVTPALAWLLEFVGLTGESRTLAQFGPWGGFFIGMAWVVVGLERYSRQWETRRLNDYLEHADLLAGRATEDDLAPAPRERTWSPFDPYAWYYGRQNRKLKQSTLVTIAYSAGYWSCWALLLLCLRIGGCSESAEMPAGGGEYKQVAQQVRVQKIIRKRFVINPLSAIKFDVPPIDEVRLQLQEITEHAYSVGYGEGSGGGFGGGTAKGKIRFIRLQYDGGDWDQDFGIGGDENMLLQYGILLPQYQNRLAPKTEFRTIPLLANFTADQAPPFVYMTGQGNISLGNNDVKTLRQYLLDRHGMLVCDNGGSRHFHNQFVAMMNRVLPEIRPVPVPLDDPIHKVPFALPYLPYVAPHGGKEALGWLVDGRWVAYYHPGDIADAWCDGHAGVSPEVYESCYKLGANIITYAYVEKSKWLEARKKGK